MRIRLHEMIADSARTRTQSPALTYKGMTLSYAGLWSEILAFAGGLRHIGLERGERVAVFLDKRIEAVVSIFGTSAADGVFVPVNPVLKPKQVAYILSDCNVRV